MKKITFLLLSLTIISCISKSDKEETIIPEPVEEEIEVIEVDKPDESLYLADDYKIITDYLDSLGLKYTTMKGEDFEELYQDPNYWTRDWEDDFLSFEIDSSQTFQVGQFKFEAIYDENMSYSENLRRHYGGISKLHISKNGKQLQTITSIEDILALGTVHITFYDFNLDGHKDMRFILDEGKWHFYRYYLYNPKKQLFEIAEDWDYVRPYYYNIEEKQFFSVPYGTAGFGDFGLYQINGNKLRRLKKIYYHGMFNSDESFATVVNIEE